MKKTYSCIFVVALSMLIAVQCAVAQTKFFADFESASGSNAVDRWVPDNAGQIWATAPFPGSGTGLQQTIEGCGISGNTPLPGVTDFSDGVIQLDMSWDDDDSWGVILRQTAPDRGYLVVFGYIETAAVIIALLDEGCATTGMCLDQTACENNPDTTLNQTPHTLAADPATLTQDLSVAYLGRIEARGNTIRVWYLPRDEVSDPFAADLGVPPLVEITDSTHSGPGSVGVWHESQGGSMVDNVLVTGPSFVSVEPQGKLAASWGYVKSSY